MSDMKNMVSRYGNIDNSTVVGMRAPFLQGGGDAQFAMMEEEGFLYDCSLTSRQYGYLDLDKGRWPYTLDYEDDTDCPIPPCPKCSYPGTWVQRMLDLEDNWIGCCGDPEHGAPCDMLDGCM